MEKDIELYEDGIITGQELMIRLRTGGVAEAVVQLIGRMHDRSVNSKRNAIDLDEARQAAWRAKVCRDAGIPTME